MIGPGVSRHGHGQLWQPAAGRDRFRRVQGMLIVHAGQHRGRIDFFMAVQGDHVRNRRIDVLQPVEIVGDGQLLAARPAGRLAMVPGRTIHGAAWQHGAVGVEHGRITHIGQGGQHRALSRGGICQQPQRVAGMHRDHHPVEVPHPAGGVTYLHPVRRPAHRAHRRTPKDLAQCRGDVFDIDRGSAGDSTPAGSVAAHEQAVIVEKRQQRTDRIAAGGRRVTGPDGGDQRQDDVIGEILRQPDVGQHRRQGQVWRHRG